VQQLLLVVVVGAVEEMVPVLWSLTASSQVLWDVQKKAAGKQSSRNRSSGHCRQGQSEAGLLLLQQVEE